MTDHFLGEAFGDLSCPFWSTGPAVWCSATDTLNYWTVESLVPLFFTRGVFECHLAHCRSVAVFCMPYMIRYKPMHPLYGVLPVPYVPVRGKRCALVAHRYTTYTPLAAELAVSQDFCLLVSVSVERSCRPYIRWRGTRGFQEQGQCFFLA